MKDNDGKDFKGRGTNFSNIFACRTYIIYFSRGNG